MQFEKFVEGNQIITGERKITSEDLDAFLDICGLHLPMFLRDEDARRFGHQRRIIPGPLILSMTMGLIKETGWFDHVVAVLEFQELRFRKALHPDESIKASVKVRRTKPTKNPRRGIVILGIEVMNQNGDTLLTTQAKYLIQTQNT